MTHSIANIVIRHRASFARLAAERDAHKALVDKLNALLKAGEVEGVPYRMGEKTTVTGWSYKGKFFIVENIFIKRETGLRTAHYSINATGAVIKMDGTPGRSRASAQMRIPDAEE